MKLLWFSLYDFLPAKSGKKVSGGSFWRSYPSEEHPRAYVRAREEAGHRQEPFASALPPFSRRRFGIEIVVWRRIKHWKLFWSESELGWRWLNDEVIQAVIVKTIRRMPKCTFKMQFQDTFAWMICLNSLFFLGERQPILMKYVWEKITITFEIEAETFLNR